MQQLQKTETVGTNDKTALDKESEELKTPDAPKKRGSRADGAATRRKLLAAARKIIVEQGTDNLSIERVIRLADVSKGTYLYHFPTRTQLIEALANDYAEHLTAVQSETTAAHPEAFDPYLAGYEHWYRDFHAGRIDEGNSPLFALVSASKENEKYLAPVRTWYEGHYETLRKSPTGFDTALLLSMAFDALFFHHLFGTDTLTDEDRERLLSLLHGLAQGTLKIVPADGAVHTATESKA